MSILLILLSIAAIGGVFALWIASFVSIAKRPDFPTEKKALWIILCIVGGILASTIYFFVFDRKKLGWWSLGLMIATPLIVILFYSVIIFTSNPPDTRF